MARILIVNDDPALLSSLSELLALRLPESSVMTTTDPIAAAENLSRNGYDIAIVDVVMPGTDGFAFTRTVQQLSPTTPVILLSGYGEADLENKALDAGASAF